MQKYLLFIFIFNFNNCQPDIEAVHVLFTGFTTRWNKKVWKLTWWKALITTMKATFVISTSVLSLLTFKLVTSEAISMYMNLLPSCITILLLAGVRRRVTQWKAMKVQFALYSLAEVPLNCHGKSLTGQGDCAPSSVGAYLHTLLSAVSVAVCLCNSMYYTNKKTRSNILSLHCAKSEKLLHTKRRFYKFSTWFVSSRRRKFFCQHITFTFECEYCKLNIVPARTHCIYLSLFHVFNAFFVKLWIMA